MTTQTFPMTCSSWALYKTIRYVHHSHAIRYTFLVSDYWSSTATLSYWDTSHFDNLVKQHFNWGYFNDDCIQLWCQLQEASQAWKKGKTLDNRHTRALLWFLSTFIHSIIHYFILFSFHLGCNFETARLILVLILHVSLICEKTSQRRAKIRSCMSPTAPYKVKCWNFWLKDIHACSSRLDSCMLSCSGPGWKFKIPLVSCCCSIVSVCWSLESRESSSSAKDTEWNQLAAEMNNMQILKIQTFQYHLDWFRSGFFASSCSSVSRFACYKKFACYTQIHVLVKNFPNYMGSTVTDSSPLLSASRVAPTVRWPLASHGTVAHTYDFSASPFWSMR